MADEKTKYTFNCCNDFGDRCLVHFRVWSVVSFSAVAADED
jgi:hypothetical protein